MASSNRTAEKDVSSAPFVKAGDRAGTVCGVSVVSADSSSRLVRIPGISNTTESSVSYSSSEGGTTDEEKETSGSSSDIEIDGFPSESANDAKFTSLHSSTFTSFSSKQCQLQPMGSWSADSLTASPGIPDDLLRSCAQLLRDPSAISGAERVRLLERFESQYGPKELDSIPMFLSLAPAQHPETPKTKPEPSTATPSIQSTADITTMSSGVNFVRVIIEIPAPSSDPASAVSDQDIRYGVVHPQYDKQNQLWRTSLEFLLLNQSETTDPSVSQSESTVSSLDSQSTRVDSSLASQLSSIRPSLASQHSGGFGGFHKETIVEEDIHDIQEEIKSNEAKEISKLEKHCPLVKNPFVLMPNPLRFNKQARSEKKLIYPDIINMDSMTTQTSTEIDLSYLEEFELRFDVTTDEPFNSDIRASFRYYRNVIQNTLKKLLQDVRKIKLESESTFQLFYDILTKKQFKYHIKNQLLLMDVEQEINFVSSEVNKKDVILENMIKLQSSLSDNLEVQKELKRVRFAYAIRMINEIMKVLKKQVDSLNQEMKQSKPI